MNKQELVRDIKSFNKDSSWLNQNDVCRYLKQGKESTRGFLSDLDFVRLGNQKKYHAADIAAKILELRNL